MAKKRNALTDVDPKAITLCKQGANRQVIFLRKEDQDEELLTLPSSTALLKADDEWSVFYCVVAEPGAEEDPGMVGEVGSVDVWADDGEIRKAAHRLLKNKGYVNLLHDALAAEDCHLVENAVALADFEVAGTAIKKGSWYIAVEPGEQAKAAIECGDFTGISLEGSGTRIAIEKAGHKGKDLDSAGTHSTCKKCKSKLKRGAKSCPNCGATGLKKIASFGERIAETELRDSLWQSWMALEGSINAALSDEDVDDPKAFVARSLDEFQTWLMGKLEALPDGARVALAKELGTLGSNSDEEDEMGLAEDFAELKKGVEGDRAEVKKASDATTVAVTGLVDLTGKLVERVEALSAAPKADEGKDGKDEPTDVKKAVERIGALCDKIDGVDSELTGLAKAVAKLGEGESSQDAGSDNIRKEKSNPLAGLLS